MWGRYSTANEELKCLEVKPTKLWPNLIEVLDSHVLDKGGDSILWELQEAEVLDPEVTSVWGTVITQEDKPSAGDLWGIPVTLEAPPGGLMKSEGPIEKCTKEFNCSEPPVSGSNSNNSNNWGGPEQQVGFDDLTTFWSSGVTHLGSILDQQTATLVPSNLADSDTYDDYIEAVNSKAMAFYQLLKTIFFVQGWDQADSQGTDKVLNVPQLSIKDFSQPIIARHTKGILQGTGTFIVSIPTPGKKELSSLAVVTYEVEANGFGTWECSQDPGGTGCVHVSPARAIIMHVLKINIEDKEVESKPEEKGSQRKCLDIPTKTEHSILYIPQLPPVWARIAADPINNLVGGLMEGMPKKLKKAVVYGLNGMTNVLLELQKCPDCQKSNGVAESVSEDGFREAWFDACNVVPHQKTRYGMEYHSHFNLKRLNPRSNQQLKQLKSQSLEIKRDICHSSSASRIEHCPELVASITSRVDEEPDLPVEGDNVDKDNEDRRTVGITQQKEKDQRKQKKEFKQKIQLLEILPLIEESLKGVNAGMEGIFQKYFGVTARLNKLVALDYYRDLFVTLCISFLLQFLILQ
ncbi:hypothetical protein BDQ12DRAFT_670757 [Crucibulum laeve]|uniref:Uncharacterized protein n=1 Tax=Crucibulum laeve TaxID=68775 RepID=A0A5C3LVR1_9AGAR|nr:hypothetical protein BDQ12DRAFT_670757 [Crucibulum laeve]